MKASLALSATALLLAGCYDSNNTRSLQQHTADATAAAKRSAGAIARGVVEGLTRKGPLDINKASEKDLAQLPGVTPKKKASLGTITPVSSMNDRACWNGDCTRC